jgi:hypothetical protein
MLDIGGRDISQDQKLHDRDHDRDDQEARVAEKLQDLLSYEIE